MGKCCGSGGVLAIIEILIDCVETHNCQTHNCASQQLPVSDMSDTLFIRRTIVCPRSLSFKPFLIHLHPILHTHFFH